LLLLEVAQSPFGHCAGTWRLVRGYAALYQSWL